MSSQHEMSRKGVRKKGSPTITPRHLNHRELLFVCFLFGIVPALIYSDEV